MEKGEKEKEDEEDPRKRKKKKQDEKIGKTRGGKKEGKEKEKRLQRDYHQRRAEKLYFSLTEVYFLRFSWGSKRGPETHKA